MDQQVALRRRVGVANARVCVIVVTIIQTIVIGVLISCFYLRRLMPDPDFAHLLGHGKTSELDEIVFQQISMSNESVFYDMTRVEFSVVACSLAVVVFKLYVISRPEIAPTEYV